MTANMYHNRMQHQLMTLIIIWIVLLRCSNGQSTANYFNNRSIGGSNESERNESNQKINNIFTTTDRDKLGVNKFEKKVDEYHSIHLATWRWNEIGIFYTITLFAVITGLSKVAFHYAHWLSSHVPESCLLIIVGVGVGAILYTAGVSKNFSDDPSNLPTFTPELFFLILLPPVILEAAYSLYNAAFFDNLATILLYAVVGTIFNTFSIGFLLYALSIWGFMGELTFGDMIEVSDTHGELVYYLPLVQCLVFSALISAVDPVAVLAIFQEVGVNKDLYFLVFGESLFNDAITVVLYNTMVTFSKMPIIGGDQYTLAVVSFFTVNFGGIIIGIFFGLLTALITRTTSEVRVMEPLAELGIAYLSYLSAELFHFSGIISIIFCGLVQAHYSFKNISKKSYVTVKYFTKMMSATSEAIIFLFLGTVLVSSYHQWNTGFVMWTLVLCLICRFIGVFVLTSLSNIFRVKRIGFQEQFLMAYGGLRGAIGFSLVVMLDEKTLKPRQVFVTTTLVVILFTVFIQGGTIKFLVKLLHIEVSRKGQYSLIEEINNQVTSHLMAGIEEVIGYRRNFYIRRKIQDIDEKYLQKMFFKDHYDNKIRRIYEKMSLLNHYAHLYGPITLVENQMTKMLHEDTDDDIIASLRNDLFRNDRKRSQEDRSKHISDLFPGVEIRRRSKDSNLRKGILRKAFLSNPYHMYHQCYNPNLINDDIQEINSQLERRRNIAKRITRAAFEQQKFPMSPDQSMLALDLSDENFSYARKLSETPVGTDEKGGIGIILRHAQKQRTSSYGSHASDNDQNYTKDISEKGRTSHKEVTSNGEQETEVKASTSYAGRMSTRSDSFKETAMKSIKEKEEKELLLSNDTYMQLVSSNKGQESSNNDLEDDDSQV